MITLKVLTDKIVIKLAAAPATTQASVAASWHDITATPTYTSGSQGGTTNGTTLADLVPGPGVDNQRVIDAINVYNNDTVSITATVSYSDNGTLRTLWRFTLAPDCYAVYTRGAGFNIFDSTGKIVTTGSPGQDGTDGILSVQTAEIDFGATPLRSKTFTITDAGITPSSVILVCQSGAAATGEDQDENEMDTLILRAAPASGSMTLYATAMEGTVCGKFKVNYVYS